ncbi:MAG: type II secretion system protein [Kiritimatiellia bacterium]
MTRMRRQGFTIVEMLMVIGVLAILMGIVTTASSAAIRQARSRRMTAVKNVIQAGIATYRSQRDAWPPENGQLDKWSRDGISGDQVNGVRSGRHLAFLSAEQYDDMMYELAKVSVGQTGASPVLDVTGIHVARKSAANSKAGRGMEFREAIKKNKKHGATYSLKDMSFGYQDADTGYFRRFIVQYNADSDNITVMTQSEYSSWWGSMNPNKSIQWPSGYTFQ